jgi:hypothetical protein
MARSPFTLLSNATTSDPGPVVDLDGHFKRVQVTALSSPDFEPPDVGGGLQVSVEWSESRLGPWEGVAALNFPRNNPPPNPQIFSGAWQRSMQNQGFFRFVRARLFESPNNFGLPAAGSISVKIHFD